MPAGMDRLGRSQRQAVDRQPFGAAPDHAAPDQSERRRTDDAEQRHTVAHQREIDREFVAAGDKFLGAVERVDQEETAAIRRFRQMDALLRQRRYVRQPAAPDLRR